MVRLASACRLAGFKYCSSLDERVEQRRVRGGDADIVLLAVCEGLEGEASAVQEAIHHQEPATVALALAPSVVSRVPEFVQEGRLDEEDAAYLRGLSRWGKVRLPPPEFDAALSAARAVGATVEGVDMPEEAYLDAFTHRIGILDLTKRALKTRWLKLRPPKAESPQSFCRAFDAALNKGPFAALEAKREEHMAKRLDELADQGPLTFVVDVPRADGILDALEHPRPPDPQV